MTLCNHRNIPYYQNIDAEKKETYKFELPDFSSINERLAKLSPKGMTIAKTVGIIGIATIPIIGIALAEATGIIAAGLSIGCLLMVFDARRRYYDAMENIWNLEATIVSWYKEYTKEFVFLERKKEEVIKLPEADYKRIGKYIERNGHYVREETHYRIEGGVIGFTSNTPIKLVKICTKTNALEIAKKYQPWIDLLIEFSKNQNIPEEFMELVGMMAGFRRMDKVEKPIGDNYYGSYDAKQGKIILRHVASSSENDVISTTDGCREFVEKVFKE